MSERTFWRTLASRPLFTSRWHNLRQDVVALPGGAEITYTWMEHPGCAVIVPLTAAGEVVMLRQYRYTVDEISLELPAGGRNPDDADLATCAARELSEELGLAAERWTALGSFYTALGVSNIEAFAYLAEDLHLVPTNLDPTEQEAGLELVTIPLAEAVAMCYNGAIKDGLSIIALLWAARSAIS
jgi:ADP-ribose pyrophosphatase